MDEKLKKAALAAQRNEITEYEVYTRLADCCRDKNNAEVLREIGRAEKAHGEFWAGLTGETLQPCMRLVRRRVFFAKLLGLTFVLKQMEKNEGLASKAYADLISSVPEAAKISADEEAHEAALLKMLDEESLQYVGSIVLGLNDALVELTGALAGFTLTLGNTKTISMAGLVTGISAAFSMAASDYLSSKASDDPHAKKSAVYTGIAYLITVIILILPFLIAGNRFVALGCTLALAVLIILCFNYYISVAKELNFRQRFFEMAGISLGVAAFSFFVGYLLNKFLGV